MQGTLLTVDRGNSTLDCMLYPDLAGAGGEGQRRRLDPDDPEALEAFLNASGPTQVVGLSVVPAGLDLLRRLLAVRDLPLPLLEAGVDLPCPLRLEYPEPTGLGADRWVAALAAHRECGSALVVDCGTALTLSLVEDRQGQGVFLGGAIAPGAGSMARALAQATPALPAVDLEAVFELPACSPQAAVNAGVGLGFAGLVDRLVERALQASKMPASLPLLITGGEAGLYRRTGHLPCRWRPDLVHQGLRCLYQLRA